MTDENPTEIMYQKIQIMEQRQNEIDARLGKLEQALGRLDTMCNDIRAIRRVLTVWDSLEGFDRVLRWGIIRLCALASGVAVIWGLLRWINKVP